MERRRGSVEEETQRSNGAPPGPRAIGDVARDVIDHVTMIVRDEVKIAGLEARRRVEHLRRDVGGRLAYRAAAVLAGVVAGLCGLVALFLGIARALDSVAWAFAIYAAAFAVVAVVAAALSSRPPRRDVGEEIARRFPAARARQTEPEHLLVAQRSSPEAHRREVEEARIEAGPGQPP
jgi:hypothetical protein